MIEAMGSATALLKSLRWPLVSGVFLFLSFAISAGITEDAKSYDVFFTENPPVVDGVVSAGEWDLAPATLDQWTLLRTEKTPDAFGIEGRALWTSSALYILIESNQDLWDPGTGNDQICAALNCSIGFSSEVWNFYFDPNGDGEANAVANPDGYQVSFNTYEGTSSFGVDPSDGTSDPARLVNSGVFGEAHVNAIFGNQGGWSPANGFLDWSFVSKVGDSGGVVELRIPWTAFGAAENQLPEGLFHPMAPQNGDAWFVNLTFISSDSSNFLPLWNWTSSQSFPSRPHGEFRFHDQIFADGFESGDTSAWSSG